MNRKNNSNPKKAEGDGLTPFEEAYLALDLNEADEFDTWYEELNSHLKQPTVNTRNIDMNGDIHMRNIDNDKHETMQKIHNVEDNDSSLNQSDFDLRQLIRKNIEKNQESDSQASQRHPNGQGKNRRNRQRKRSNHMSYGNNNNNPNQRHVNTSNKSNNRMPYWLNNQACHKGLGAGLNSGCCSIHNDMISKNVCNCNKNAFANLNFNMPNTHNNLPCTSYPCGCNAPDINKLFGFMPPYLFGCNNGRLNNVLCLANSAGVCGCQLENLLKHSVN